MTQVPVPAAVPVKNRKAFFLAKDAKAGREMNKPVGKPSFRPTVILSNDKDLRNGDIEDEEDEEDW